MKKLMVLFIALYCTVSHGQEYRNLVKPVGSDYWGYINLKGELIIPAKYRKAFEFSDGYAVVLEEGSKQYYFINEKGEKLATEVTSFGLKEIFGLGVKGFQGGFAPVKIKDKWGFLDKSGKMAIAAKYTNVGEFYDGYSIGEINKKHFIISSDGSEIPVTDQNVIEVKHFSDGLAPFTTTDRNSGFLNSKGQVVIPATFMSVGYFYGGLAWAKNASKKVGFINQKGEWVIEPAFDQAQEFDPQSGMARVKTGDAWGYVSKSGERLNMSLESYGDFMEGLCYGKKVGAYGFFDNKGNWVIEPKFAGVRDFKNGYAAAKKGEAWGIIDKKGEWVVEPKFAGIRDVELIP
jgi:WG containing repeat